MSQGHHPRGTTLGIRQRASQFPGAVKPDEAEGN